MKSTKAKSSKPAAKKASGGAARQDVRKKSAGKKFASKKHVSKKGAGRNVPRKPIKSAKPVKHVKRTTPVDVVAPKKKAPKAAPRSPIVDIVLRAMDDMKAVNIVTLDVRGVTDVADAMVIASGNSDRHVRAIADRVREFAKQAGHRPLGVEGERDGEWVLVDLNDVIVHVMLPRVREFYRLESLWDVTAARREASM
jgi:ribosome-associated protein